MITEVFYFFLLIACIQSSTVDTQLFRPLLLNQNGQLYISNKNTINRNKNDFEPKIVGGIPASSGNTKYQVSIRLRAAEGIFGNGHICGGSLISYKTVLTAAHCLFYYNDDNKEGVLRSAAEFVIVMGTMNRFIKTSTTLSFRITRFMYHAHFDTTNMIDDIALIFLDGEVPVNYPTVHPIAITTFQVQDGAVCQINGWGTTTFEGSPTNILLTSNVTILSRKVCAQSYGDTLFSGMMCAGDWTGAHDACQGDSGGPLAYQNILIGIVSWGNRCGSPGWPGIYTNVYDFRNWIDTNNKLPKPEPKIIGGTPATLLNTTYQVSIRIKANDIAFGSGHICGGSLIKLNVVLTAAHCLYYLDFSGKTQTRSASELKLVMGTLNLYYTGNSLQSSVTRYVIHELYNPNYYPHDLAVLFLNKPVPAGHAFIRPIPIASSTLPTNSSCQVSGFGSTRFEDNASPSPILLVASIQILDYTRCKATYGTKLDTGMLCAGVWNGTRDSCQGDSGGPLACSNNNVLSGVVSWGDRCGIAGSPGVYANVASYYNWIIKNRSSSLLAKDSFLFINLIAIIIYFNKF